MTRLSDFGKAFREARQTGKKTFTWKGKLYTTKLREEASKDQTAKTTSGDRYGYAKAPQNVPVPADRPTTVDARKARTDAVSAERATSAKTSQASSVFATAKAAERTVLERSSNRTKASVLVPDLRIVRKPRKRNGELY